MRAARRNLQWLALAALFVPFVLGGCGKLPDTTERARGLLSGQNVVLAMTVLVLVIALGLIATVIGLDRFFRSRHALAEAPEPDVVEEEEEQDEVVAGIRVGRAAVPRWLYGAYVLIPIFAFTYIASNVVPPQAETAPTETEAPAGPCTECEISAAQIAFDTDTLEVAAGESITVTFDNEEQGVPHDFTVWEDEAAAQAGGEPIATTGVLSGPSSGEATFDAPEEPQYFNCTIHPQSMFGTVEPVEA